jgi:hypothetical protein
MEPKDFYNNIGVKLKSFIKDRYGSNKKACLVLHINQATLSAVIRGTRRPNFVIMNRLEESGFDVSLFDYQKQYINFPEDGGLSDYKFIVGELKRIISTKSLLFRGLEMELRNSKAEIQKLRDRLKNLQKKDLQ